MERWQRGERFADGLVGRTVQRQSFYRSGILDICVYVCVYMCLCLSVCLFICGEFQAVLCGTHIVARVVLLSLCLFICFHLAWFLFVRRLLTIRCLCPCVGEPASRSIHCALRASQCRFLPRITLIKLRSDTGSHRYQHITPVPTFLLWFCCYIQFLYLFVFCVCGLISVLSPAYQLAEAGLLPRLRPLALLPGLLSQHYEGHITMYDNTFCFFYSRSSLIYGGLASVNPLCVPLCVCVAVCRKSHWKITATSSATRRPIASTNAFWPGRLSTWPYLSALRNQTAIELCLDRCVRTLRAELRAAGCDSNSFGSFSPVSAHEESSV